MAVGLDTTRCVKPIHAASVGIRDAAPFALVGRAMILTSEPRTQLTRHYDVRLSHHRKRLVP